MAMCEEHDICRTDTTATFRAGEFRIRVRNGVTGRKFGWETFAPVCMLTITTVKVYRMFIISRNYDDTHLSTKM